MWAVAERVCGGGSGEGGEGGGGTGGGGDGGGEVGGGGESASAAVRVAEGGRSSKDRVLLI